MLEKYGISLSSFVHLLMGSLKDLGEKSCWLSLNLWCWARYHRDQRSLTRGTGVGGGLFLTWLATFMSEKLRIYLQSRARKAVLFLKWKRLHVYHMSLSYQDFSAYLVKSCQQNQTTRRALEPISPSTDSDRSAPDSHAFFFLKGPLLQTAPATLFTCRSSSTCWKYNPPSVYHKPGWRKR